MSKKFPSDKTNGIKNALFFLAGAPAHHSFTFNLSFLFLSKFIFLFNKIHGLFDSKTPYLISKLKQ